MAFLYLEIQQEGEVTIAYSSAKQSGMIQIFPFGLSSRPAFLKNSYNAVDRAFYDTIKIWKPNNVTFFTSAT